MSGSTDAVDASKRRKVIPKSPLERAFQNTAKAELDNRILVGFRFTLQKTQIIVIPMHMLLPITFQIMFLLDTMF